MAPPFWQAISSTVQDAIVGAFGQVKGDLDQIAKDAGEAAQGGGFLSDVGDIGNFLSGLSTLATGVLGDVPVVGNLLTNLFGDVTGGLDPLSEFAKPAGKFGNGIAWGYALGSVGFYLAQPYLLYIQHFINNLAQSAIPDPSQIADFVVRGLESESDGLSDAQGMNLQQKYFDMMLTTAILRPGVPDMLQMLRRNIIENPDFITGMTEEGVSPFWQQAWQEMARVLLSPADIALGVLRGDITQADGEAYVQQLGIGPADFQTLLFNTGEPPGLQDMLFGYRRGYLTKAQLEHGILQSRVRDEWIPFIEQMRYVPMSTADAVRASVQSYLTQDAAQSIAEQNGLEPTHFQYLYESWGRPLSLTEMGDLVHRGQASWAQFDQAMRESDLKDKYIPQAQLLTVKLLPIFMVMDALKAGILSLEDAASQLLMQGYDQVAVSTILKYGTKATTSATHDLTKAEIVSLYADGGLTAAQAESALESIGFTKTVADQILKVQDLKTQAAEVRAELKVVRSNFVSGAIDNVQAENEMTALGLTKDQVTTNLQTWTRAKLRASKQLSEAQIVKAAKTGTYTPQQALNLLVEIGYQQADAIALLQSNGIQISASGKTPISGSDTGS
jgi:hypothetical protein